MAAGRVAAKLTKKQIVALAVYAVGGHRGHVDTEDIAIKANEIAPGRFSWRRYPEQVDKELVRACLANLKKAQFGEQVTGRGNDGWMLTESGLRFARKHAALIGGADLSGTRSKPEDIRRAARERQRMLDSAAFAKAADGRLHEVTVAEAEAFFRLNEYITGKGRTEKVLRALHAIANDSELAPVAQALASKVT